MPINVLMPAFGPSQQRCGSSRRATCGRTNAWEARSPYLVSAGSASRNSPRRSIRRMRRRADRGGDRHDVTLSADDRAVDGATGARFLAAFRELIEPPLRLVV